MNNNIEVQVRLYGAVQMNMGWKTSKVTLPALATIADLLKLLTPNQDTNKSLLSGEEHSLASLILHNSTDIKQKEGLATKLTDGDVVEIVSVISGG